MEVYNLECLSTPSMKFGSYNDVLLSPGIGKFYGL